MRVGLSFVWRERMFQESRGERHLHGGPESRLIREYDVGAGRRLGGGGGGGGGGGWGVAPATRGRGLADVSERWTVTNGGF